jgi:protein-S-isoprenylcysteine O-methyltransferase Ste14
VAAPRTRPPSPPLALPDLGPHGEGWFAAQIALGAVALAAGAAGPEWVGAARVATLVAGAGLLAAGGLLSLRGIVDLGRNLTPFPKPLGRAELVDCGVYGLVRHPIYGGLIVGAVGWGLATASLLALLAAAAIAAFFYLKSRREERWLAERYEGYPAYRARTRCFIPWLA